MRDKVEVFQRESDAFSWYMERDPVLRSTIVAVAWLASSPDWDVFTRKLERATRVIPSFRMCVVEPPARLATPRWVVAPDFDLDWHLRRVDAPLPRTPETVIALARTMAMDAFDPARPLWEFTLVERLQHGRAALIMKVHHSLTDGIGGMKLALHLFDTQPEPGSSDGGPAAPAAETLSPAGLVRESLVHDWDRIFALARHEVAAAAPAAWGAVRAPVRAVSDAVATARSVGRMVAPVSQTLSPVMTDRGLGRHLDMLTVSLPELKRAGSAAGGTLNDAFLTALTGGLRRYHERHGAEVGDLRVTLPISLRKETDPEAGNRITLERFTVPVGTTDPAARMQEIGIRCRAARDEPALPHTNAIAGALNLLPPSVVGGMLKHVDFLASNVPGFPFPVYLAGAELTGYFPFGPTIGASVNATLLSYNGTCCVGVTIDTDAVPDGDTLITCLAEGFDEVLALGGAHQPAALPLHAGPRHPGPQHAGGRGRRAPAGRRPARPA